MCDKKSGFGKMLSGRETEERHVRLCVRMCMCACACVCVCLCIVQSEKVIKERMTSLKLTESVEEVKVCASVQRR